MKNFHSKRKICRLCESKRLVLAVPLAPTPVAEKYLSKNQLHEKVSCSNCKLCSYSKRSQVVAFLAHGAREKKVNVKLHG